MRYGVVIICLYLKKITAYSKLLKILLEFKTSTPSLMVYGECGKVPLAIKIKVRIISYWTRLISIQERSLNHIMYNIL